MEANLDLVDTVLEDLGSEAQVSRGVTASQVTGVDEGP